MSTAHGRNMGDFVQQSMDSRTTLVFVNHQREIQRVSSLVQMAYRLWAAMFRKGSWIKASWSSRESKLSGTGHTPKHSLPPMVVWAWLGCRLLSTKSQGNIPCTLTGMVGFNQVYASSTPASLALRRNVKNGNLNGSSLRGRKIVRHP